MARARPVELLDRRDYPILVVDDEPENLRTFELSFRREFTILTAPNADEGMRVLSENPVAVVLSDHKMPKVTGVEFLARVREFDPRAIRMLVTAYGDAETLGHAINDGCIYRYIPKPWEPDDMRLALRQAIDLYALDRERETLVDELSTLVRLSRALHREIEMDRLIDTLLDAIHEDLGYDGAGLALFDEGGDTLQWQGMRPLESPVSARVRELRIHRENAGEFLDEIELGNTQRLAPDQGPTLEPPIREWVTEVSAQELLIVPLVSAKRPIGLLAVDNRRGGRRFGANDRTLLDGIATQAVVAIENARLVEDLRASRHELRRAERMGTFGILARDLAAEMHPPLVSIQSFVSLAPQKRESDDPGFWDHSHACVSEELDRIRERLSAIEVLGRDDDRPGATSTDVGQLAQQVGGVLTPIAALHDAQFELEVEDRLPPAVGRRAELRQVLLSVGLMAARHAEAHSTIHLCVRRARSANGIEVEWTGPSVVPSADLGADSSRAVCRSIIEDCGGGFEDLPDEQPPRVRIELAEGSRLD